NRDQLAVLPLLDRVEHAFILAVFGVLDAEAERRRTVRFVQAESGLADLVPVEGSRARQHFLEQRIHGNELADRVRGRFLARLRLVALLEFPEHFLGFFVQGVRIDPERHVRHQDAFRVLSDPVVEIGRGLTGAGSDDNFRIVVVFTRLFPEQNRVAPGAKSSIIFVRTGPGHTALTRMLADLYSSARARVKPITANLEEMYALRFGPPFVPQMDDTLTM